MNDHDVDFLNQTRLKAKKLKIAADRSLKQIADDKILFNLIDEESNSLALLMKHISGNMVSRWRDFSSRCGCNHKGPEPWSTTMPTVRMWSITALIKKTRAAP